jgi:AraC-like DNA-binding protein
MRDRSEFDQGDLLSEMLERLRFHGGPGANGSYATPWELAVPASEEAPFYVVAGGSCRLEIEGQTPLELTQGDLVLLPRGDAHTLRGPTTQLVGGYFRFDSPFSVPVLHAMGSTIVVRADDEGQQEGIKPLLSLFCRERRSGEPGSRAAMSGLLKLLFIQILREVLTRGHDEKSCAANPLVLLFDPSLRKAAEAIHFEYQRPWTIADLADLAGMSRTTFAVKFQELTGTSPLAYLTQVRMLDAIDKLEGTNQTLEAIAQQVGYGSEAAFSTAFKRELGLSPGAYRKAKTPSRSA